MFWCWLQEWICSCADVVASPDIADNRTTDGSVAEHIPEPIAVYRTVIALHEFALHNCTNIVTGKDDINNDSTTTATNTKTADCVRVDNEDDNHYAYMQMSYTTDASTHALAITNRNNNNNSINSSDVSGDGGHWSTNGNIGAAVTAGTIRKAPRSLDLNSKIKKRKMSNTKRTFSGGLQNDQLNEILEECEYDSESGKFNCIATTTSTESSVDFNDGIECSSLNAVTINGNFVHNANANTMGTTFSGSTGHIRKRIEFFENNCDETKDEVLLLSRQKKSDNPRVDTEDTNNRTSTICCLLMFLCTALFLYLFPVEN